MSDEGGMTKQPRDGDGDDGAQAQAQAQAQAEPPRAPADQDPAAGSAEAAQQGGQEMEESGAQEDDAQQENVRYSLSEFAALAKRFNDTLGGEDDAQGQNMETDGAGTAEADDGEDDEEGGDLDEAAIEAAAVCEENPVLLATNGKLDILRALVITGKYKVNEGDDQGYTALMAAASYGQLQVVKFLLEQESIKVNQADSDGDTALHYCTDVECMQLLLANGGDLSRRNGEGLTPLESLQEEIEDEDMLRSGKEGERIRALAAFLESRGA